MAGTYAGANTFHANVATIEDGDPARADTFQPPLTQLTDRTSWIKANAEGTIVTTITDVGSTVYLVPANCIRLDITSVGGGQAGGNGGASYAGHGGQAGEIREASIVGTIPANLTCLVGAGGNSNLQAGQHSYVTVSGSTVCFAAGGGSSQSGAPSDTLLPIGSPGGAWGGVGGVAAAGERGQHSSKGAGGSAGSAGSTGSGGKGYGAGGGGGRNASGASSGGSGGGGGFGTNTIAAVGSTSSGGAGAQGCVVITATIDLGAF